MGRLFHRDTSQADPCLAGCDAECPQIRARSMVRAEACAEPRMLLGGAACIELLTFLRGFAAWQSDIFCAPPQAVQWLLWLHVSLSFCQARAYATHLAMMP